MAEVLLSERVFVEPFEVCALRWGGVCGCRCGGSERTSACMCVHTGTWVTVVMWVWVYGGGVTG